MLDKLPDNPRSKKLDPHYLLPKLGDEHPLWVTRSESKTWTPNRLLIPFSKNRTFTLTTQPIAVLKVSHINSVSLLY